MDKSPIIKKPEIVEETEKYKSKRKKKQTSCVDKRRKFGTCGICGNEVIIHGFVQCEICFLTIEYFVEPDNWWWWRRSKDRPKIACDCYKKNLLGRTERNCYDIYISHIEKEICPTCFAYERKGCPSCGNHAWFSPNNKKVYCKKCGFRR